MVGNPRQRSGEDRERIFAVGDIHGCYDKLVALMGKIDVDWNLDKLIFLGDYIDRGPNAFEVVEYLVTLRKKYSRIIFLKGNHEEMLEKYLSGADRLNYLQDGGQPTLDSYLKHWRGEGGPIPEEHLDFFRSLVLFHETTDYIFVHAGLRVGVPLERQVAGDLLWIRDRFIQSKGDFGKRVVFGHTPFQEPLVQKNKIGIDTGAVYNNELTCVRLPDETFFSV
ncbi:MAG: metallophosphoesterase family protein [Desulfobacterales bacterium]|jgi:serine/threonine protein phosphatase 1|nr:metallophosphoesterase family protein [Desulfobacterales bacterium]